MIQRVLDNDARDCIHGNQTAFASLRGCCSCISRCRKTWPKPMALRMRRRSCAGSGRICSRVSVTSLAACPIRERFPRYSVDGRCGSALNPWLPALACAEPVVCANDLPKCCCRVPKAQMPWSFLAKRELPSLCRVGKRCTKSKRARGTGNDQRKIENRGNTCPWLVSRSSRSLEVRLARKRKMVSGRDCR